MRSSRFGHHLSNVLGELRSAVLVIAVRGLVEVVIEAFELELLARYLVSEHHRATAVRVVLIRLVVGLGYVSAGGIVSGNIFPVIGVEYLAVLTLRVLRHQERRVRARIGERQPKCIIVHYLNGLANLSQRYRSRINTGTIESRFSERELKSPPGVLYSNIAAVVRLDAVGDHEVNRPAVRTDRPTVGYAALSGVPPPPPPTRLQLK